MRVKSYRAKPEPISFTGPPIPRHVGEKTFPSTLDVIVIAEKYYAFNPVLTPPMPLLPDVLHP
jgi:hypothetical protein